MENFDVIIIGAGSVGVPLSMFLAEKKVRVLVIDELPSFGQGQNKAAIGGVRATHSDGSKIRVGLESIKIFSSWKSAFGDDIGWKKGGYLFPVYEERDEKMLKEMLRVQHSYGLEIKWINPEEVKELAPGINPENLRGGTYSPKDGSASPLLAINAFYRRAKRLGARFAFGERVVSVDRKGGSVCGVSTNKSRYSSPVVVNAAGAFAKEVSLLAGVDIPVRPDCHEAGICEPAETGIAPMIVDIRPQAKSKNYYFYPNSENQIVFCLTPRPPMWGTDRNSTSAFLPEVSRRMINLMPSLASLRVRRIWRGLYPMTPDGFPIVDMPKYPEGYVIAAGMCGQGFMLGPGLGKILSEIVTGRGDNKARAVIKNFRLSRNFSSEEKLK